MALGVVISHQYSVAGIHPPSIGSIYLGTTGVLGFFAISGFLIMGSWCNDPHPLRFGARRLLRMVPGLTVMTLLVVFVLGPYATSDSLASYFDSRDTWKYFSVLRLWNFEENLPGVFLNNPGGRSVNASLWSIPIEVRCYIAFAFAAGLTLFRSPWALPAALVAYAVALFQLFAHETNPGLYRLYLQLGAVFIGGVVLFQWRAWWKAHQIFFVALVLVAGGVLWLCKKPEWVYLLFLTVGVVLFGSARTPVLCRVGRVGDLSYGTYIYSFPVQQALIWSTGNQLSVAAGLAICIPVVLALAWLSWHCVEAPALRLKTWIDKWQKRDP